MCAHFMVLFVEHLHKFSNIWVRFLLSKMVIKKNKTLDSYFGTSLTLQSMQKRRGSFHLFGWSVFCVVSEAIEGFSGIFCWKYWFCSLNALQVDHLAFGLQ